MPCIKNKFKIPKSFTLIELVIVSFISLIVSLGIYKILDSGIKIWQKINKTILEEDVNIFFQKFALEISGSFRFDLIGFKGKRDFVSFPALINSQFLGKDTVGEIIYYFDSSKKTLIKEERDFSQIYNNDEGRRRVLISNLMDCSFEYYTFDEVKQEYLWQQNWEKKDFPLAIRIKLILNEENTKDFIKIVNIPISS